MSKLPDAEKLAALVSHVTSTMCGVSFVPGDPLARGESLYLQMVMIPLRGDPDVTVVLSSDTQGSRALGAAFFSVADDKLTQQMIDDAIAELLNMVAGQISMALQSNHTLGLPRRTRLAEIARAGMATANGAILLRSEGAVDLGLWILENPATGADEKGRAEGLQRSGLLRSILGK